MECGGKRSATPLWIGTRVAEFALVERNLANSKRRRRFALPAHSKSLECSIPSVSLGLLYPAAVRFTDYLIHFVIRIPAMKSLGYFRSSAMRTQLRRFLIWARAASFSLALGLSDIQPALTLIVVVFREIFESDF